MMDGAAPIRYLVFDLGKVLIDYRYDDFFALLRQHGVRIDQGEDFLQRIRLRDYEHGGLSCEDFLAGINRQTQRPLPLAQLTNAWNGLFSPITEMLELAARLKTRYPVFLLSNIGRLHWEYLLSTYQLDTCCHDRLASFEVGAMKPAADIYAAARHRFGLEPEATLFIDDKVENISGALACGWQGMVHRDPATTIARLRELMDIES